MTYDYKIESNHITVTIKDITADNLLDALCDHLNFDAIIPKHFVERAEFAEAIWEMALEYILIESPQVDYYHEDELDTIDVLNVNIHCGRIYDQYQFIGDVSGIRYNKIERGAYA